METYSQVERLIRILQILSTGRKITTTELRERFTNQVSIRTLQRDLLLLSESGIPLISEKLKANENVWYVDAQFKSFLPIPLNLNEYLLAQMLRENLKVLQKTTFGKEINSLLKKIDQIVPGNIFMDLTEFKDRDLFENYSSGIFDYEPYSLIIDKAIQAIVNRKKCKVIYVNPEIGTPKSYPVEPEKMVYYKGGLYLIAYMRMPCPHKLDQY